MTVRKTEARIPEGMQASDLGQAFSSGNYSLVSYLTSPIAKGTRIDYAVFAQNNTMADRYEWTFLPLSVPSELEEETTNVGINEYTPENLGELRVVVDVIVGGNTVVTLTLSQIIVERNAELEQYINGVGIIDSALANWVWAAARVGDSQTTRELVNDLKSYIEKAAAQHEFPLDFLAAIVYKEVSFRPKEYEWQRVYLVGESVRSVEIEAIREILSNEEYDNPKLTKQSIGVCQISMPTASMVVFPDLWRELPVESDQRELRRKEIRDNYTDLDSYQKIDLFNILRFPRTNILLCAELLSKLKNRPNRWEGVDNEQLMQNQHALSIIATEYNLGATMTPREDAKPTKYGNRVLKLLSSPFFSAFFGEFTLAQVLIEPSSTKVVKLDELLQGTIFIEICFEVSSPSGLDMPDDMVLEVRDFDNQIIGNISAPLISPFLWDGSFDSGERVEDPGVYSVCLVALKDGGILSVSNMHEIKILQIELTVRSPNSVPNPNNPNCIVHPIEFEDPRMPALTIEVGLPGLSSAIIATLTREVRLAITYDGQYTEWDPATNMDVNRTFETIYLPGPTNDDWYTIDVIGQWPLNWGNTFCGGDLEVYCRVKIDDVVLQVRTSPNTLVIWGKNAPKATVRNEFGANVSMQVVGHRESRFTQFSDNPATLNQYRAGPLTVLRSFDNGYGIGQLTKRPPPTLSQLWNWKENVQNSLARLNSFRNDALTYLSQVRNGDPWIWDPARGVGATGGNPPNEGTSYPNAPNFTADQLDLEMWSRYNSGYRYHNYNPASNSWVRRLPGAVAGLVYADELLAVRNNVNAGNPPGGWG